MAKTETTPEVTSQIWIIKFDNDYVKVLRHGVKVVVRCGSKILFNNLKSRRSFDKWWSEYVDSRNGDHLDITKDVMIKNEDMITIHKNYKG